jgi:hypothetical protein
MFSIVAEELRDVTVRVGFAHRVDDGHSRTTPIRDDRSTSLCGCDYLLITDECPTVQIDDHGIRR